MSWYFFQLDYQLVFTKRYFLSASFSATMPNISQVISVIFVSKSSLDILRFFIKTFFALVLVFHNRKINGDVVQANGVDGMLILNRGESEWWSFFDIGLLNSSVCGDLKGPMAIVVSEETPRKHYMKQ